MAVSIELAQFPRDIEAIHTLFSGYAASLGIDLTFQSFQNELDSLPGKYDESQGGALLIARAHRDSRQDEIVSGFSTSNPPTPHAPVIGCVALRRSSNNWCEMKRLYVLPAARGLRLGDKLVVAILEKAKSLGYSGIRLDTLPDMIAAQRLYRRHGFVEIDSYYDTPIEATIFMGCEFSRLS
ncbi:uncharacterized protein N7484_012010 [Penicillium longicatenatum]|uniref:uncharacterized protein n=1 Tax=Penicillium longicatenatum TaxID=1561947 RepID=UPI0025469D10|nr:uncharacterized protein N7484_012010 [Penicillium longicatenatum]KAJ5631910.1 hypothetical protein N7484_012010 [Penicillium longicatenatum]